MERLTLNAKERIKNSNEITTLIRKGQAFFLAPYKVYYTWDAEKTDPKVRVAFAIPKKRFSRAVQRNRLKRLSRECFRLQKPVLQECVDNKNGQLNILFMYQKTKEHSYPEIYKAVGDSLKQIIKHNG